MPRVNIYNIVTNDELELPVACDLVGTEAAAEWLGVKKQTISACICKDHWSKHQKYKAIIIESFNKKLPEDERKARRREYSFRHYHEKRRTNNE